MTAAVPAWQLRDWYRAALRLSSPPLDTPALVAIARRK